MSDDKVREVERRYQQSGSLDDETALLRVQHQVGELTLQQLKLAAFLGHTPARRLLGDEAPTPWSTLISDASPEGKAPALLEALADHGHDAILRAAFAAAEAVVWEFRAEVEEDAHDPRPAEAADGYEDAPDVVVEAIRAWLEEPTKPAAIDGVKDAPACVSTELWEGEHEILQDLYLPVFNAEGAVEALRQTALAALADDAAALLERARAVLGHAYYAIPSEKVPVGDAEDMGLGLCALVRDALLPWTLGRRDLEDESLEQQALGATSTDVELVTKLQALEVTSPLKRALIDDYARRVLTLQQPMTPGQRARALELLSKGRR